MEQNTCIQVKGAGRSFGEKTVFQDITLDVQRSEIFGLLGPSGSGKTTLVKLIAGISEPAAGEVFVLGEKMPKLSLMQKIGYMAQ